MAGFDESKFHLGKLCKRGHEYGGTGRSLRNKSNGCVECQKLLSNTWREKHRDHVNELCRKRYPKRKEYRNRYDKKYHEVHGEEIRARKRDNYHNNREYELARGKRYREENREKINKRHRQYVAENHDRIMVERKEWYCQNRERILARRREIDRSASRDLSDRCIKYRLRMMGVKARYASPELAELKRLQLKAYRASQAYKKGKLTCQTNS